MKTQGKQRIFDNSTILSQIKVMWRTFPDQFPSVAEENQSAGTIFHVWTKLLQFRTLLELPETM